MRMIFRATGCRASTLRRRLIGSMRPSFQATLTVVLKNLEVQHKVQVQNFDDSAALKNPTFEGDAVGRSVAITAKSVKITSILR
jgi:hypothetical protein